eukprot:Gb_36257 [translate_table: standard]
MDDIEDIQPLVCDNGTRMVKVGFIGDDAPRAMFSSIMGWPHHIGVTMPKGLVSTFFGWNGRYKCGSTMFLGIANHMSKEITTLAPSSMKIKVVAPPKRKY